MVLFVLLTLNDKRRATLFPDNYEGHYLLGFIDIEEHPVFSENSKLVLCNGIRPKPLPVTSLEQRIRFEESRGFLEDQSSVPAPEPAQVGDDGLLHNDLPRH